MLSSHSVTVCIFAFVVAFLSDLSDSRPADIVDKQCIKDCLKPHVDYSLEQLYCDDDNLNIYGNCALECFANQETGLETMEQDWHSICVAVDPGHSLRNIGVDTLITAIDIAAGDAKRK